MASRPRLAIAMGDPAGVGPEIVFKALSLPDIAGLADYGVFGSPCALRAVAQRLNRSFPWASVPIPESGKDFRKALSAPPRPASPRAAASSPTVFFFPRREDETVVPGRWSRFTGWISHAWASRAAEACLPRADETAAPFDALVTAPICKAAWKTAGAKRPGHTELLAEIARKADGRTRREVMMLVGGGLRVALATIHTPLARVPEKLSANRIAAVARVLHQGLQTDFGLERPRIAVLGLNPHAGEDGMLGDEETRIILPALRRLERDGISALGPLPADTAFHFARRGRYDAVLAMYHDQGLGPLKTVAFEDGVNVTLGLPLVRTSVDHGAAFDLAGQGEASEASMAAAIRLAIDIVDRRRARLIRESLG